MRWFKMKISIGWLLAALFSCLLVFASPALAQTFAVTAVTVSPVNAQPNQTEQLIGTVVASANASNYNMIFTVTLNGTKVVSKTFTGLNFTANNPLTKTFTWQIPGTAKLGVYKLTVNITKRSTTYASGQTTFSVVGTIINGQCGSANGSSLTNAPTTNLCAAGGASPVSGTGPWNWSCSGSNGGITASCQALLRVNGSCGPANLVAVSTAPTSGLCSIGNASTVSGSGPWSWGCAGSNGGTTASCSAPLQTITVNGVCGPANSIAVSTTPTSGLCSIGSASTVSGSGPWSWGCAGSNGGTTASCSAPLQQGATNGVCGSMNGVVTNTIPTTSLCSSGTASPVGGIGPWSWTCNGASGGTTAQCATKGIKASLHYAPNANLDSNGKFVPGADGFNLADVSNVDSLNILPAGVKGLVWLGLCNGVDSNFISTVTPFIGNAKLYAFYLMDEPDPTGQWAPLCTVANLKAESDWIHSNVPGAKTFIVMMNLGTPTAPTYANTYNPANTDIDLFGLDPYPIRPQFPGGVNYNVIGAAVNAAVAEGIPLQSIVPVYQAFGGGGYTSYALPTSDQEQQILSVWAGLLMQPAFDCAYSWGVQSSDSALVTTPSLQTIFLNWNTTP